MSHPVARATPGDPKEVLRERAARLARPLDDLDRAQVELLVLAVGTHRVAVPAARCREIRLPGPLLQIAGNTSRLEGLLGGSGAPLAVVSVAGLLGVAAAKPVSQQWVAVLDDARAPLGLLVDAAEEVVRRPRIESAGSDEPGGLAVAIDEDGTVLLDADALLRDPRLFLVPNARHEETL